MATILGSQGWLLFPYQDVQWVPLNGSMANVLSLITESLLGSDSKSHQLGNWLFIWKTDFGLWYHLPIGIRNSQASSDPNKDRLLLSTVKRDIRLTLCKTCFSLSPPPPSQINCLDEDFSKLFRSFEKNTYFYNCWVLSLFIIGMWVSHPDIPKLIDSHSKLRICNFLFWNNISYFVAF